MKNAINIIEKAKHYFLLSNDRKSQPILVGNRIRLEYVLEGIDEDMIILTTGNDKRCLILIDYNTDEVLLLVNKADKTIMSIKAKN